jgi:hypothetical protein
MSGPNWARLVAQGRAKAHGVSWSADEQKARVAGIPADYVRRGCLTQEDYDAMKETDAQDRASGTPSVVVLTRTELEAKAKELGIEFAPETTDDVLRDVIKKAEKKADKEAAKAAKKADKNK